ncbi:hypothetical protein ACHAWF_009982 [Thalassiosira exigua]
MPKASKVGKFRAAAKASSRDVRGAPLTAAAGGAESAAPEKEKEGLSRGMKKRLAKREKYLKRQNMIMSSLRLQRMEEQKGRLDGLDAIREALGEVLPSPSESAASAAKESSKSNKTRKLACSTNKSKKKLANAEISHMGLILEHPSFQDNPFAAIQKHLQNSLAPDAERMRQESHDREEKMNVVVAKKKEQKKERLREAKFSKKSKANRSKRR